MNPKQRPNDDRDHKRPETDSQETPPSKQGPAQPGEERGERLETAKAIARGGKQEGHVQGAMESK